MLGIFGKVKDKERPATQEDSKSEALLKRPETLNHNEATSIKTTPEPKLQYARKLNVNGVELYQLFTSNSREDVIQECIKAEAIMRAQGSTDTFMRRVEILSIPRLDQVNLKEALVDYLWTLFDLIDERVAIQSV